MSLHLSEAIVVLLLFTPDLIQKKKVEDKQHNSAKAMTLFFVDGLCLMFCVIVCCAFKRTCVIVCCAFQWTILIPSPILY
jgi:hypothetical protein